MTALSQRKLSAWVCGACLATIWACPDDNGIEVERLIPGLLFGAVMAVSMIRKEQPIPFRITLAFSGILFAILIALTVLSGPAWKILVVSLVAGAFVSAQWLYFKSFRTPATDP